MVLRSIGIVEQFQVRLGCVLQQDLDFTVVKLASQAERAGSIPATRSSFKIKGLAPLRPSQNSDGFTGGFTLPIPVLLLSVWSQA